ncbi:DUF885 domain-containing protein [Aquimonas sp.]|uniref:DUF885 domain-containing protein n=1 Tax=Aquimonas sp. TaxID=1872588 RepID=UPI0037C0B2F2
MKWILRLLLVLLIGSGGLLAHTLWFKPLKIEWFYERVFAEFAFNSPELLSSLRILPSWLDWYSDDLDDASMAGEQALRQKVQDDLATLRSYDRESLDADGKLSYDLLETFLATQADGDEYAYHNYPLNQLFGIQNGLPTFLATQHPINSPADATAYISRLGQIQRKYSQVMEGLRHRETLGILPPRFVVEKVLTEMRAFVAGTPESNLLYTSFDEKLRGLQAKGLSEAEVEGLRAEAKRLIQDSVYPAYGEFIAYYEALLPKVQDNHGVWSLPDGAAYYAWEVRSNTTTDMTPDEVHALGLSEVERIGAEMDAILQAEGLTEGSIGARVQVIAQREDQLYPDTDEGRQQIIDDFQTIIDEIDQGVGDVFNLRPDSGVKVERVPEFREKTAPGAYYNGPAFDGSRPGIFYINLRNTKEVARFSMRTLAYHEAIPGHHFQIAIQQELTGVPTFRKLLPFTAYAEGWALYTERLAWEMGFQDKPLDNLGRLQAEMFRAVRLVVDTGMHHKRWTREQAIAYMLDMTGMPETDVVAEIERYLVMPGQALAYKVGMNAILEARERAKTALGERFDLKAFHDVVLKSGSMPMTLMNRQVDDWVKAELAKTAG